MLFQDWHHRKENAYFWRTLLFPLEDAVICNGVGMTQLIRFYPEEDKRALRPK